MRDFNSALAYVMKKNQSLYRRLASQNTMSPYLAFIFWGMFVQTSVEGILLHYYDIRQSSVGYGILSVWYLALVVFSFFLYAKNRRTDD